MAKETTKAYIKQSEHLLIPADSIIQNKYEENRFTIPHKLTPNIGHIKQIYIYI